MKRSIRFNRLLATALAVAAWPLAQVAAAGPAEPMVPIDIAVPAGHKLYLVGHAVGVQIHRCDAIGDGYKWNLVGPRAELFGDNGKLLTTHFAGPRWQAKDGSTVVGSPRRSRDRRRGGDPVASSDRLRKHRPRRRPACRNDVHPADRDDGRPRPCSRELQRRRGRHGRGSVLHR